MERALELAVNGLGTTSPNPMVGCVIVYEDKIIGEGWHMQYGGAHAEVNAIDSLSDKSLLPGSTVYVTLEPCSHHGLTPPCSELLISSGVKKVVICNVDPNPIVKGNGIRKLVNSGIEVATGVLSDEGEALNKRFFTYHNHSRPYIILKWAETADGFVARENFDSKWISNEYSRQLVHQWRAQEDAILVGKNTVLHDNPSLTVRDAVGKHPTRIVLDHHLELPIKANVFDGSVPTVCYNLTKNQAEANLDFVALNEENFPELVLNDLYKRKILSLIIEGGSKTLQSFIDLGFWDEARVFKSNSTFKKGIEAPVLKQATLLSSENIIGDQLFIYQKNNG